MPDEDSAVIAANNLEAESEGLLQRWDFAALAERLNALPPAVIESRPGLLRLRAHLLYEADDIAVAFDTLERARELARQRQDLWQSVACALDLARLHQRREQMDLARAYLDEAQADVMQHSPIEPALEARVALAIGRFGQDESAVTWCTRALHLYEELKDVSGQVDALWHLAVANTYRAHLDEAAVQIERALRLHRIAGLGEQLYLYLLNVRAHVALYSGHDAAGLEVLREAAPLLQRHPHSKPALYLAVVEAELQRQRGHLRAALAALDRAARILEASHDEGFRPWLQLEQGWTELLAGAEPAAVRRALLQIAGPHYKVVQDNITFYLAALDMLDRCWSDAQSGLEASLAQFAHAGEAFKVFACHMYLAYVHLFTGQQKAFQQELEAGLGWAETMRCDGFPHLWHPQVMATLCVAALRVGIRPRHAELMIARRLGDVAVPSLLQLLSDPAAEVRQRAKSVLAVVGGKAWMRFVTEAPEKSPIHAALLSHLREGRLALSRLDVLHERLKDSDEQATWQRLAVFGYYTATDMSRVEIANALAMSDSTVKRHIAAVRAAFGIQSRRGRDVERKTVQHAAYAEGFVVVRL